MNTVSAADLVRAVNDAQWRFEHGVGPEPHTYLVPAPPVLGVPVPLMVPVPALPGSWVAADLDGPDPE